MSDPVVIQPTTTDETIYGALSAPFDLTFKDVRGGVEIEYLSGEQVISRLNTVLGVFNWRFVIQADGVDEDADEVWVRGRLLVRAPDTAEWIEREQYGSQKIHRPRANCGYIFVDDKRAGEICDRSTYQHPNDHPFIAGQRKPALDIGFDRKGATTDCLKKCASLFGIGLYLSHKEAQPNTGRAANGRQPAAPKAQGLVCATCKKPLPPRHTFADGKEWTSAQIADFGRKNFNTILCIDHLRAAREAAAAAAAKTSQSA